MKRFFIFLVSALLLNSATYAYESVDFYVEKVENMIEERGASSRILFLKALNSLSNNLPEGDKKILIENIYNDVMITFDGCGVPENYMHYSWFEDFQNDAKKQLSSVIGGDDGTSLSYKYDYDLKVINEITEICYSENANLIVFSINLTKSGKQWLQTDYSHHDDYLSPHDYMLPLNMYMYRISNQKIEKATLYEKHFQTWGPPFEVREDDNITTRPIVFFTWNDYYDRYMGPGGYLYIREFGKRYGDVIRLEGSYGDAGCMSTLTFDFNIVKNEIYINKACGGCYADVYIPGETKEEGNLRREKEREGRCKEDFSNQPDFVDNSGEIFWSNLGTHIYDNGKRD